MKNQNYRASFLNRIKRYFFGGILITVPISVSIYIGLFLIRVVDKKVALLIPDFYNPNTYLPFEIPGIGLVVVLIGFILIGMVSAGIIGRMVTHLMEVLVLRTPILKTVYSGSKQIIEAMVSDKEQLFSQVVMVEYPRVNCWVIGFMITKTQGEAQALFKEKMVNVFVPTTPNPTSGFLLVLPKKDIKPLSMTVEEGLKMVISGGIITPDFDPKNLQKVEKKSIKKATQKKKPAPKKTAKKK
ncbi:MAG: DUF502 domain-containing protein [Alphaproteobacteria bacterium]